MTVFEMESEKKKKSRNGKKSNTHVRSVKHQELDCPKHFSQHSTTEAKYYIAHIRIQKRAVVRTTKRGLVVRCGGSSVIWIFYVILLHIAYQLSNSSIITVFVTLLVVYYLSLCMIVTLSLLCVIRLLSSTTILFRYVLYNNGFKGRSVGECR